MQPALLAQCRLVLGRSKGVLTAGLVFLALGLAPPPPLGAQVMASSLPSWEARLPMGSGGTSPSLTTLPASVTPLQARAARRSHAWTGLLIGGAVGAAATGVFLVGFCGDPDTSCGADEVGRAVVVIAMPCAAAGALIGWLVRTEEEE